MKALKLAIRDSKRESYLKLCGELENDPLGRRRTGRHLGQIWSRTGQ